jgi:hypothetical protein
MLAKQEDLFLRDLESAARECAGATVKRYPSGLSVKSSGPDGFDMAVIVEDGHYSLYFDNWAEELENGEIAREMFEAALKGNARLRVDMLSGRRWRWTLEKKDEDGSWLTASTTGHVLWRFWGRQSSIYLRNAFPKHPLPTVHAASSSRAH